MSARREKMKMIRTYRRFEACAERRHLQLHAAQHAVIVHEPRHEPRHDSGAEMRAPIREVAVPRIAAAGGTGVGHRVLV